MCIPPNTKPTRTAPIPTHDNIKAIVACFWTFGLCLAELVVIVVVASDVGAGPHFLSGLGAQYR